MALTSSQVRRISPDKLRSWILDGQELAILDAREEGEFGADGHLFWAVPCPLSQRELRARALLPRLAVRIACVDAGRDGLAERLAGYLEEIGCTDVAVLDGGTPAWREAGGEVFTGVNVPSKAFGEWVEHHYGTPSVDAAELKSWMESGRKLAVLDSRPLDEFRRMSIPTGINVPGAELAYRVGDLVPDPDTVIVVNCAGRTRSILGAESLRRAGVPNPVVALRNGTMGWELAGLEPDRGRGERYEPGRPRTADAAAARARAFAESTGVGVIGPMDLARYQEDPDRTCYVLDVRDPAEFAAGHRPGSRSAPGGQLVQATDRWVGVRGARICLLDDQDGVRARMTGAWLHQMGHRDVFVVEGGLEEMVAGSPAALAAHELDRPVQFIAVDAVAAAAAKGSDDGSLVIVDLARSIRFRAGHIPGAAWGVRTRLGALAERLRRARQVVLTSPDGVLARLAVEEAEALAGGKGRVFVLDGGTHAWIEAGRSLEASRGDPPDDACIDFYLRPYDRNDGVEEAMRAYLDWEVDLVGQVERDGTVRFGA